jgi:glutaconate CoA-transferase subunit A
MNAVERQSKLMSAEEAAALVHDGSTLAVGGSVTASHPMTLIRAVMRRRVRDLVLIGSPAAGLEVDMLIAAGCVRKVVTSYVGAEGLAAVGPMFRMAAERGEIEVWEGDEGICVTALRAAAQRLPFLPWRGGVGTSLPALNPELKPFRDPINGEELLAVPALRPDVAFVYAERSDEFGNAQPEGTGFTDPLLARAAKRAVVQVEQVVPTEVIRRDPARTKIWDVIGVVRAPYGTHPFSSHLIGPDREHIGEYLAAVRAVRTEGRAPVDRYLEKYVYEPDDHLSYLERIGARRLVGLHLY